VVTRGLFIGRYQPPHWGHVWAIDHILREVDELVVAIGSSQFNYILRDPFTVGERIIMLREGLREVGVDLGRVIIVPVPNIENNAAWVAHLRSFTPPFHVAYSGNPFVRLLLRDFGVEVRDHKLFEREKYNSTRIREMMIKGDPSWEELVPKSVAKIIKDVGGIERMRIISLGEAEPHRW